MEEEMSEQLKIVHPKLATFSLVEPRPCPCHHQGLELFHLHSPLSSITRTKSS